jgi:hypothetical protein
MYKGAIDSISGIVNVVDGGFIMVISFVAFFIISVALLKNVLAGAYCAFPKFWDKVDLAHKEVENDGFIQRFRNTFSSQGVQQINMGTISKALLSIMPNIKTLTEFEDNTLGVKNYFIRAIPQMLVVIMIGAFIYNGFYRDTAIKVADFGSEIFARTVLAADPIALFDQITGSGGRPDFSTGNSPEQADKDRTKVFTTAYEAIIGRYNDISTAEEKARLVASTETLLTPWMQEFNEFFGNQQWKMTASTTLVMGEPNTTFTDVGYSGDKLVYKRAHSWPITEWNLISNKEVGREWYVFTIVTFNKQAIQPVSALTNLVMHFPRGSDFVTGQGGFIRFNLGSGGKARIAASSGKSFKLGGYTFTEDSSDSTRYNSSDVSGTVDANTVLDASNLYYWYGNQSYMVRKVQFDGSGGITFTADEVEAGFNAVDGPNSAQEEELPK